MINCFRLLFAVLSHIHSRQSYLRRAEWAVSCIIEVAASFKVKRRGKRINYGKFRHGLHSFNYKKICNLAYRIDYFSIGDTLFFLISRFYNSSISLSSFIYLKLSEAYVNKLLYSYKAWPTKIHSYSFPTLLRCYEKYLLIISSTNQ